MKNSKKHPIILQRFTKMPDPLEAKKAKPVSIWVAFSQNTEQPLIQGQNKDLVLKALATLGNYQVTKVLNDWN